MVRKTRTKIYDKEDEREKGRMSEVSEVGMTRCVCVAGMEMIMGGERESEGLR